MSPATPRYRQPPKPDHRPNAEATKEATPKKQPRRPSPNAQETRDRGAMEAYRLTLNQLLTLLEKQPASKTNHSVLKLKDWILKQIHDLEKF